MKNLGRGYRRLAGLLGLLLGPTFIWWELNVVDPQTGMTVFQELLREEANQLPFFWIALGKASGGN